MSSLIDFLPEEIEAKIFELIDPNTQNRYDYEKEYWKSIYNISLNFITKEKLSKYILSYLVNRYNASYKYFYNEKYCLASHGLIINDSGLFQKGNGRFIHTVFIKAIKFLHNDRHGIVVITPLNHVYNKKQQKLLWILRRHFDFTDTD